MPPRKTYILKCKVNKKTKYFTMSATYPYPSGSKVQLKRLFADSVKIHFDFDYGVEVNKIHEVEDEFYL